jgi:serine/threonine protein kinase/Flp pilus assembly protein TadD
MQPGTAIGPYVVRRHLGDGGMGSVWLAEDTRLRRQVALKTLRAAKTAGTAGHERLMREARAAAALNHPHIATVYDVIDIDGEITIVFEFVDGHTLASAIPGGAWPIGRVIQLGTQLAKALVAAHASGIIHRDLKPANVMIGADDQIKVLDFGIARLLTLGTTITTGVDTIGGAGFMGTPAYAAPEQMVSSAVDERADLYSLGVMLFEMASGRRPFAGHDMVTLASAKLGAPAPSLSSVGVSAPKEFEALVAALLQRNAADRPDTAADVFAVLRSLSDEPTTASLPGGRTRPLRWAAAALALAAAVIALVMGIRGPMVATLSAAQPVIAVLPLRNASTDAAKDFVAAGLSESLIASLASSPSMIVLSRGAVADAIKNAADTARAAKDLGANFVIDGSVQQSGGQLRVTINVVRADQSIAWGDTFDGSLERVFELQTRMALAVGEALSARLSNAPKPPTTKPAALEAYWRGRAFLDRWDVKGNLDAAVAAFSEAIAEDPGYSLAHAAMGVAYWRKYEDSRDQQYAKLSVDAGTRAAALDPNLPEVHHTLGMTLAGTGRTADGVRELRIALDLRPTFDEARRLLAQVIAREGRIDEAVPEFQKAIALRPRYWGGYNDLGVALFAAGRHADAAAAFERVVELQADSAFGHQQLGTIYQTLGQDAKAIEAYQRSIAITPSFGAYSNLGVLYHSRKDYARAVEMYLQALALRPTSMIGYRNLGDSYTRMGRAAEARQAYLKAVERAEASLAVNANDARSLASLAVYLAKAGRSAEALERLTRALALSPDDAQIRYRAAVVNALLKRDETALNQIAAAIERGYSVRAIQDEEDFMTLRGMKRFAELTQPPER